MSDQESKPEYPRPITLAEAHALAQAARRAQESAKAFEEQGLKAHIGVAPYDVTTNADGSRGIAIDKGFVVHPEDRGGLKRVPFKTNRRGRHHAQDVAFDDEMRQIVAAKAGVR